VEVVVLSKNSIKIKGKKVSIVVDPQKEVRTSAEVVLLLSKTSSFDSSKIEGKRIEISGPGEYEASGIKIAGELMDGNLIYDITLDYGNILLAKSTAIEKSLQKKSELAEGKDYHVAILAADNLMNSDILTKISTRVLILYGEKAEEAAKSLGKQDLKKTSKFSAAYEKLPQEMETVVLE